MSYHTDLKAQRQIATILSAYDDLIENNTRRIAILEEMTRALYQEWFVHFRFPGYEHVPLVDSPLGPIPEGWSVRRLDTYGSIVTGKTPSKKRPEYFGGMIPFVRLPDMHDNVFVAKTVGTLSSEGASSQSSKMLQADSLCVSCIGTVGVVNITTRQCQTNQQINSIVLGNPKNREFLYHALVDLKKTIVLHANSGATMANLSRGKFCALQIYHPPDEIRLRYNELVAPMFDLVLRLQYQNDNLRTTRDLLLPKLISGEIDVSALPEEPIAEAAD